MEDYNCPRCGYETDKICNFKKHLKRKSICDPKLSNVSLNDLKNKYLSKQATYECNTCERKFTTKSAISQHAKHCLNKLSMAKRIDKLERELLEAREIIESRDLTITNNIQNNNINNINNNIQNNTNNIQNNINVQVVVNPLGHENTNYISDDFMLDCIKKKVDGLTQFILKKHFDPNHPENHNIKIDGDYAIILEHPMLAQSRDIISRKPEKENLWIKLKTFSALEENIMPRVETAFKTFFSNYPDVQKSYIEDFIKEIVFPMDWSMDLDEEDDIDYPEDSEIIKRKIYQKIKNSIDNNYAKLINIP